MHSHVMHVNSLLSTWKPFDTTYKRVVITRDVQASRHYTWCTSESSLHVMYKRVVITRDVQASRHYTWCTSESSLHVMYKRVVIRRDAQASTGLYTKKTRQYIACLYGNECQKKYSARMYVFCAYYARLWFMNLCRQENDAWPHSYARTCSVGLPFWLTCIHAKKQQNNTLHARKKRIMLCDVLHDHRTLVSITVCVVSRTMHTEKWASVCRCMGQIHTQDACVLRCAVLNKYKTCRCVFRVLCSLRALQACIHEQVTYTKMLRILEVWCVYGY